MPDHGEGEDKDGVKEEFMGGEDIEDFLHMPPPIVALPDQCSADEQAKSESPSPKSIPAKIKIKVQEVQRYTIPAKRTSTVSTTSHPSTSSTTDNTRLSLTNFPHFLPSDPLGWGTVYLNLARLTRRAAIDTITNGERYWEVGGQQVRGRGVSWPRWLEWKEVNEKGDRGWRRKVSLGQGKGDGGLPMVG